jgi:hypothetical protein
MIEYVRSMHQFMSTGQFGAMPTPTYDIPSYAHQPGFDADTNVGLDPRAPPYLPANQMNFQPSLNAMTMQHPPMSLPGPWPQTPTPCPMATPYFENNASPNSSSTAQSGESSMVLKTEEQVHSPTFTDSSCEGKEEDAVTLSPSAFLWQEMVLPGCNDETGTCQCGDGCECVGCLTHGGHNGVALQMMEGNGHDRFPSIASTTTDDLSNQYPDFTTAPT